MAKFGLNADSDSDGDADDRMDSAGEEDVPSHTPSSEQADEDDATMDRSQTQDEEDDDDEAEEDEDQDAEEEDEDDEFDEENAPPLETLDDEDDILDTDYVPPLYPVDPLPQTRSHSRTPEPLGFRRRSGQAPEPETPQLLVNANREWRKNLGLEPKKVALMQRSLFAAEPESLAAPLSRSESWKALPAKGKTSLGQLTSVAQKPPVDSSALRPPLLRPRDFPRIALKDSYASGKESSLVDAGLAFGRSFRPGWGPGDTVVGRGPIGADKTTSSAPLSQVTLTKIPTQSYPKGKETTDALRLLAIQLRHTSILSDDGIPSASPSPSLRFSDFSSSIPSDDRSHEASVWRLGRALFDEIDLGLPQGLDLSPEALKRISSVRREDAFSAWLQDVVGPAVEHDVRLTAGAGRSGPETTFRLLTGYQLDRACDAALTTGDLRLSTLIALAGGEDPSLKADLLEQVSLWREKRIDGHIDPAHRKIYELLSGNVAYSKGFGKKGLHVDASADVNVAEGLDWKRAFGLHFWYQASHVNLWYAIKTYEAAFRPSATEGPASARPPLPWYVESPGTAKDATKWKIPNEREVWDPLFHLIKMSVDPTHDLETVLSPRGFGPSPFDHRLPWHLYILFSRVLGRRDFSDRQVVVVDEEGDEMVQGDAGASAVEGNSARADRVTTDYAKQLEKLGLWEWAAFVLLHLELPEGREIAIKDLLERNIHLLDDAKEVFLVDTLQIPVGWIASAQASLAHYQGEVFEEFKRLIEADRLDDAHTIAVAELAPEAIIHNDLVLLRRLFNEMGPETTAAWPYGGKLFIDYADLFETLPRLLQSSTHEDGRSADRLLDRDLPALLRELPTLYSKRGRTPTTKQQVCTAEMISRLNTLATSVSRIRGRDYSTSVQLSHLQGADRLPYVVRSSADAFASALEAACAA